MDYIYAEELKRRFVCYGHFYDLVMLNGERAKCRSVLEIVHSPAVPENPSDLSEMPPDAVVIMMNPGSSHPIDIRHVDGGIEYPQPSGMTRKELVLTRPDNTQYQVMRVAVHKGWDHIRVLNLSDLRDPKSGSFLRRIAQLAGIMGGHTHSIFCSERSAECAHALRRKGGTPVLLGWGQHAGLIPLAEQCIRRLDGEAFRTVPSEVHPLLNAHPSPMLQSKKMHWLRTVIRELET